MIYTYWPRAVSSLILLNVGHLDPASCGTLIQKDNMVVSLIKKKKKNSNNVTQKNTKKTFPFQSVGH